MPMSRRRRMVEATTMPAIVAGERGFMGSVRWSWFSGPGRVGAMVDEGEAEGEGVEVGAREVDG